MICWAWVCWVCRASAVITTLVRSSVDSRGVNAGISLLLAYRKPPGALHHLQSLNRGPVTPSQVRYQTALRAGHIGCPPAKTDPRSLHAYWWTTGPQSLRAASG